jgi:hypothetical protein
MVSNNDCTYAVIEVLLKISLFEITFCTKLKIAEHTILTKGNQQESVLTEKYISYNILRIVHHIIIMELALSRTEVGP